LHKYRAKQITKFQYNRQFALDPSITYCLFIKTVSTRCFLAK